MKLYDRQIRLWGLETQRGLLGTRILLIGVNGLGNEIAKNLVLAGVGHLHVLDAALLREEDLATGALFSVARSSVGSPRAAALCKELHDMNGSVRLSMWYSTPPLPVL